MTALAKALAAARAEVARLERVALGASCEELGHDWKHIGGRNCGCFPDACCSVPVYECGRCGDCDYGDNGESNAKREGCEPGLAKATTPIGPAPKHPTL